MLVTGFASCLGAATPTFAVEPHAELRLMRVGDMLYMSGGGSRAEQTVLDHRASDFQVRVNFIGKDARESVRQVFVTIVERKEGNAVIKLKTAGPVLLMNLPVGRYTLTASTSRGTEGVASQLDLEVGKKEDLRVVLGAVTPSIQAATAAASSNRL
ncbi:MAG TPA: hypothetical protein VFN67_04160 [Polyangiales bacterium]|nr:hypothetical protein [Polyangiales bacterium]